MKAKGVKPSIVEDYFYSVPWGFNAESINRESIAIALDHNKRIIAGINYKETAHAIYLRKYKVWPDKFKMRFYNPDPSGGDIIINTRNYSNYQGIRYWSVWW